MVAQTSIAKTGDGAAELVIRLAAIDGIAAHPHLLRLSERGTSARDLSDAVHALCSLHGHHPDLIEIVASLLPLSPWLDQAASSFAVERLALTRLVAAAGPLPSTPGQAETAAAMTMAGHALEMLARSERKGVSMGAVAALVIDWAAVRPVLANAAERWSVALPASTLPDATATADALAAHDGAERAIGFGAQQLFAQDRALWDLLEARASARGD